MVSCGRSALDVCACASLDCDLFGQFILNCIRSLMGTLTFVVLFTVMRIVAYFNWFPQVTPFLKRQSIIYIDFSFFWKVRMRAR